MKALWFCIILSQTVMTSVAFAQSEKRRFLITDKFDQPRILEIAIMGGENPLSEECLNGALKGASSALIEKGAQPYFLNTSKFPVARIILDSRGYEGICELQTKAGESLQFVYLDRTGVPHGSRRACQEANRTRSNLHLRVTPFQYVKDRKSGVLDAKRGFTSHMKLSGSPSASPAERAEEARQCERWTNDLFLGRLTTDRETGMARFDSRGSVRVTKITPMLDRVLAGMRTNLAQLVRPRTNGSNLPAAVDTQEAE